MTNDMGPLMMITRYKREHRNSDVIPRGFPENDTRFPLTPMSDWYLISPSNDTPASHIWGHEKKKWLPVKEALGC